MNYKIEKATESDSSRLKKYKLKNIFEYAEKLPREEIIKINNYVKKTIPIQL